ncbi:hypothetical protein J2T14_005527 [Paenibacillus harenae]|nr:hypothetical protein [Paenibacillus harenae]
MATTIKVDNETRLADDVPPGNCPRWNLSMIF